MGLFSAPRSPKGDASPEQTRDAVTMFRRVACRTAVTRRGTRNLTAPFKPHEVESRNFAKGM
jgi:hypothetical protein